MVVGLSTTTPLKYTTPMGVTFRYFKVFNMRETERILACIKGINFLNNAGESLLQNPIVSHRFNSDVLIGFCTPKPPDDAASMMSDEWYQAQNLLHLVGMNLCKLWMKLVASKFRPTEASPKQTLLLLQGMYIR